MTTSGSTDYNNNRAIIISTAYQIIQQYGAGETIATEDDSYANVILNQIAKMLPAYDGFLWKRQIGYVFLDSSKITYSLGNLTGDDNATDSYRSTTLTAALSSSGTSLTVDSITGISANQNIGIMLDDASLYWTTVSGTPSGSTVTIASATNESVSAGNRIFTYTTKLARPLKIVRAFRREYTGTDYNDIPIKKTALIDYIGLTNKAEGNSVLQFVYSRKLTSGLMYTWPVENSGQAIMGILYDQQVEDFDAASDTPDFPQYWLLPLSYLLAYYLSPSFGIVGETRAEIKSDAFDLLKTALEYDADDENIKIEVDTQGNGGN